MIGIGGIERRLENPDPNSVEYARQETVEKVKSRAVFRDPPGVEDEDNKPEQRFDSSCPAKQRGNTHQDAKQRKHEDQLPVHLGPPIVGIIVPALRRHKKVV